MCTKKCHTEAANKMKQIYHVGLGVPEVNKGEWKLQNNSAI